MIINSTCFFTSFNRAYSAQALLWLDSIRNYYSDSVDVCALLIDGLTRAERAIVSGFDEVLHVEDLGIDNFDNWIYRLNIVEAATAAKPFALRELLNRYERVIYMDPDTYIYSGLHEIDSALDDHSFVITPHQLIPNRTRWIVESTELQSLIYGVYNLGFLAVKSCDEGIALADWWCERCYLYCISNPEKGLFTDQKFFDAAPALFSEGLVLRHYGYNVATWNVHERNISLRRNYAFIEEDQLRFCHFTKASNAGIPALERSAPSSNMFYELFYSYVALLEEKRADTSLIRSKWDYSALPDGTIVDHDLRMKYRADFDKAIKNSESLANTLRIERSRS